MVVGLRGERRTGHHPDGGDSGRGENCGATLHVHGPSPSKRVRKRFPGRYVKTPWTPSSRESVHHAATERRRWLQRRGHDRRTPRSEGAGEEPSEGGQEVGRLRRRVAGSVVSRLARHPSFLEPREKSQRGSRKDGASLTSCPV